MVTIQIAHELQQQAGALKHKVLLQPPCMCRPAWCNKCFPGKASLVDRYGMLPCCRHMRMT